MKYYLLKTVSDPKIKGIKTGLSQVGLDEQNPVTLKLQEFFFAIGYWEREKYIPDFEIKNCTATLHKNAKLTDFLDFRPNLLTCPFMISDRLAEVLSKFKIQQYFTYPVTLYDAGKLLSDKYYIFCCPLQQYDVIDFSRSVFYSQIGFRDKHYIYFESQKEFESHENRGLMKIEKLVLNSKFDSSLDLFETRLGGMYISEGLKDAIEILGFTGVNIYDDKEPEIVIYNG